MKKALWALALAAVCATTSLAQNVKINEVSTADPTWVEIANLDTVTVDLSGWQVRIFGDAIGNPTAFFTFPGIAGSGTVVLGPEQTLLIGESITVPTTPVGVARYSWPNVVGHFAGVPTSVGLYDPNGNGIDVTYISNANAMQAPLFLGTGTPTVWNGSAGPLFSGVPGIAPATATYRHQRVDSDDGSDWTNNGTGTPGALNPHQTLAANVTSVAVTSSLAASRTCGNAPLTVNFTNTSTGQPELTLAQWDMDAAANPGTSLDFNYNAQNTFTAGASVTLTCFDVFGGTTVSAATVLTVNTANAIVPGSGVCYVQDFQGAISYSPNPCGGLANFNPTTSLDYRGSNANARYRVLPRQTINAAMAWVVGSASASAGDTVMFLDSQLSGGAAQNDLIVHFDGVSIGAGNGFVISMYLMENNDETDAADVIALQDGTTLGNGTQRTGATETFTPGVPTIGQGVDGFKEVLLKDWNIITGPGLAGGGRVWVNYTVTIDPTFMASYGLTYGPDMRLIIRQADNNTFEGNDGLAVDGISVRAITPPGLANGQPGDVTAAMLNIAGGNYTAYNYNCSPVGSTTDPNGPHFAYASAATGMTFKFDGEANQPIVLLAGALNPNVANFSGFGIGQLDVGLSLPVPQYSDAAVLADGTKPDFLNSLFRTGATGHMEMTLPVNFPPGIFSTFQAAIFNSATIIRLSNAVQLTVF